MGHIVVFLMYFSVLYFDKRYGVMAYDDLFGLPRRSRHVIPKMMNSEDTGYTSLPVSLHNDVTLVSSNSVVQMLEKRRHQSQKSFSGVWHTQETLCDNEGETDEEILNDFLDNDFDTDLGFDREIMISNKMTWSTINNHNNDDLTTIKSDKNSSESPWIQQSGVEPGNNSDISGLPHHNTKKTKLDSIGNNVGNELNSYGKTEVSSVFIKANVAFNVTPNIERTTEFSCNSVIIKNMRTNSNQEEDSADHSQDKASDLRDSVMSQVDASKKGTQPEDLENESGESLSETKRNQLEPTLSVDSGHGENDTTTRFDVTLFRF